jgi:hypothetical protein
MESNQALGRSVEWRPEVELSVFCRSTRHYHSFFIVNLQN